MEVINISKAAEKTIEGSTTGATFRKPNLDDGADVWELVKDIKVLDLNSSYSYLMWCSYFSETSIVVELNGKIVGFVSGFLKPTTPNRLFVWQVAVCESQRGKGYASSMVKQLLKRDACSEVRYIDTTVTPSNKASQKLFAGLARDLNTDIQVSPCFTANDFPEKGHEDEMIHQIGPF